MVDRNHPKSHRPRRVLDSKVAEAATGATNNNPVSGRGIAFLQSRVGCESRAENGSGSGRLDAVGDGSRVGS